MVHVLSCLRDVREIQRAHDVLHQIVLGAVPHPYAEDDAVSRSALHAALDVLCWCLHHHDHATTGFAKSLADIEASLAVHGFVLRRVDNMEGAALAQDARKCKMPENAESIRCEIVEYLDQIDDVGALRLCRSYVREAWRYNNYVRSHIKHDGRE